MDFLPEMVRLQDEPIADPVCVPVYYVSKLARDNGVVVAQVGEGADELFCGYPWWQRYLSLQRLDDLPVPRAVKRAGLCRDQARWKGSTHSPTNSCAAAPLGQPIFWGGAEAFTQTQKAKLLSPRLRQQFDGLTSWDALAPIYDRFRARAWEPERPELDDLRRPEPPAAGAAAHARGQDEHGSQPGGTGAVPRSPRSWSWR